MYLKTGFKRFVIEAGVGIEPTYKGFAVPCLTTWLPRRKQGYMITQFTLLCKIFKIIIYLFNKVDNIRLKFYIRIGLLTERWSLWRRKEIITKF